MLCFVRDLSLCIRFCSSICSGAFALRLLTDLASLSQREESGLQSTSNASTNTSPSQSKREGVLASMKTVAEEATTSQSLQPPQNSTPAVVGNAGLSEADWKQLADASWPSLPEREGNGSGQSQLAKQVSSSSSCSTVLHAEESLSSLPASSVPMLSRSSILLPAGGLSARSLQSQLDDRSMILADSDDDEPLHELQELEKEESVLMSQAFWGEEDLSR